jgi:hypothetical protein
MIATTLYNHTSSFVATFGNSKAELPKEHPKNILK